MARRLQLFLRPQSAPGLGPHSIVHCRLLGNLGTLEPWKLLEAPRASSPSTTSGWRPKNPGEILHCRSIAEITDGRTTGGMQSRGVADPPTEHCWVSGGGLSAVAWLPTASTPNIVVYLGVFPLSFSLALLKGLRVAFLWVSSMEGFAMLDEAIDCGVTTPDGRTKAR